MKGDLDDKRTLRVASVQFESLPGDKDANFRKIESFVEYAAQRNARLIIFPECCITGYWFIRNLSLNRISPAEALTCCGIICNAGGTKW